MLYTILRDGLVGPRDGIVGPITAYMQGAKIILNDL